MNRLRTFLLGALLVLLAAFTTIPAAHALSPGDQDEIESFTLDDTFWSRYSAAIQDAHAQHLQVNPGDPKHASKVLSSIDNMVAEVNSQPGAQALLTRHGLTTRQSVVGALVLFRVSVTDSLLANPKTAVYAKKSEMPSASNMAFYRAHKAEIQQVLRQSKDSEEKEEGEKDKDEDEDSK